MCSILNIEGTATVTDAAGAEKPVKKGDELHEGDLLEVGLSSYVDLQYDNNHRNVSRIEADSEVTISQLSQQDLKLKLKLGGVYAKLKALPTNGAFEVQTPTAIASVRGSVYRTTHNDDVGTKVYNLSSSRVSVSAVDASGQPAGSAVTLDNLEKTQIVKAGEEPKEPERMSTREMETAGDIETDVNKAVAAETSGGAEGFVGPDLDPAQAEQALLDMANAYQNEEASRFFSYVSDDFPNLGELQEFSQRDFRDYDGMKLSIYIKRSVKIPGGISVKADWQLQYQPTALSTQLTTKGENLEFVFAYENGRYKLKAMRGSNPLFGARSTEVSAASGVSSAVVDALQSSEDSGDRTSKQTAMLLVSADVGDANGEFVPVTIEITSVQGVLSGTAYSLNALPGTGSYYFQMNVRLISNPTNVSLHGVSFTVEATSGTTSFSLSGSGDLLAGQHNTLITSNSVLLTTTYTGNLRFVLDPNNEFVFTNRDDATTNETYLVL